MAHPASIAASELAARRRGVNGIPLSNSSALLAQIALPHAVGA
jgi:hypothetical protein